MDDGAGGSALIIEKVVALDGSRERSREV